MAENSDIGDLPTRDILSEILKNQKLILEQNTRLLKEKESGEFTKKKIEVPGEIRDSVRKAYKEITETEDDDEEGQPKAWNFSKTRRDIDNVKTSLELMQMVKGWHPDAPKGSIRVAIQRYYTSLYEANLRKKKNKDEKHRNQQKRYERRKRKLKARRNIMEKTTQLTPQEKLKYAQVMELEYMSSEHSHTDEEHGHIFIRPQLPWRSEQLDRLYEGLDKKHRTPLSKRSVRMGRVRFQQEGLISVRKLPPRSCPNWAIDSQYKKKLQSSKE